MLKTREQAYAILTKYNESPALIKHALAVEAVMRHFAQKYNEDADHWGFIGLLHDVDYEKYPQEHCKKAVELLRAEGVDEADIYSVVSHGWGICAEQEPLSALEKTLYTIDELTGLVAAASIMRPSKSVLDLELKSLKKKFKDLRFAAGCNRDVIVRGAQRMGLPLDDVMQGVIDGMQSAADALDLRGTL